MCGKTESCNGPPSLFLDPLYRASGRPGNGWSGLEYEEGAIALHPPLIVKDQTFTRRMIASANIDMGLTSSPPERNMT